MIHPSIRFIQDKDAPINNMLEYFTVDLLSTLPYLTLPYPPYLTQSHNESTKTSEKVRVRVQDFPRSKLAWSLCVCLPIYVCLFHTRKKPQSSKNPIRCPTIFTTPTQTRLSSSIVAPHFKALRSDLPQSCFKPTDIMPNSIIKGSE